MKILKYPLEIINRQVLRLPKGAVILTAQEQDGKIVLWAEVNDTLPAEYLEDRHVHMHGTGQTLPILTGKYVATVQHTVTGLVLHVFDGT